MISISEVARVWVGGRNGGGGVPAKEPTGMFSTSERGANMRQNMEARWQIAEGGTRRPDPDARTRRRRKVFWCGTGWVSSTFENRAQLWDPGRVQRGLKMKGWTCRSKPGAHVMTCYHYTTRRPHLCSIGEDSVTNTLLELGSRGAPAVPVQPVRYDLIPSARVIQKEIK